jgi:beta-lactamase class A
MKQLIDALNTACDAQPFVTRWYLHDLDTGEKADRDGDVVGPSASTRKVPILLAALKEIDEGRWCFEDPLSPDPAYQRDDSGCFHLFRPGFTLPLIDHLTMMIIVSDNTSTGMLVDKLGLDRLNAYTRAVGMASTTHRDGIPSPDLPWDHAPDATNATTPRDMGRLLELILAGAADDAIAANTLGLSSEFCRRALDILGTQKVTNLMPYLLPPQARVAHKTGTGVRDHADVGIVFHRDRPRFILTVYCDHVAPVLPDERAGKGAAQLHIARLTRLCWDRLVVDRSSSVS